MPGQKSWTYDLFVDGAWTGSESDQAIEVIDPATEELIGAVPEAGIKDTVVAIEAARRAFDDGPWPWMSPKERGAAIKRFGEALDGRRAGLRELLIAECGATGFLADGQIAAMIDMVNFTAENVEHAVQWAQTYPPSPGPTVVAGCALLREPVGVVAAITPFNFPFMLNLVKTVPAMAVGCTVVLKPHPWTPLDGLEIAKAAEEAGIPAGVLNVISGGAAVGEELSTNPMVDMVTFTGSTATGRRIMEVAARTVKKLQLELGGKSAMIVLDDVPDENVAQFGFGGVIIHAGQGCSIHTRLLLPEHQLDAYLSGLEQAASFVKVGDPHDPATFVGPLIREQQRERVEGYVTSGLEEGARLVVGGRRPPELTSGYFYEPTVFVDCENNMRICQEEIFGPVLSVLTYRSEDEAIRIANDTIYGLAGGVMSANGARAFNVARQLRAGSIETTMVTAAPPAEPAKGGGAGPGWSAAQFGVGMHGAFGGYKQSGIGREWGGHGMEEFTEIKSVAWT